MRATIRNAIQAAKRRREENGEAGFSLIELIVVVVILGILAAVAIPVFLGLQKQAEQTAQDAVAGNAASQAAADLAKGTTPTAASFSKLAGKDSTGAVKYTFAIAATGGTALGIDNFCVTVTGGGASESKAGPGC